MRPDREWSGTYRAVRAARIIEHPEGSGGQRHPGPRLHHPPVGRSGRHPRRCGGDRGDGHGDLRGSRRDHDLPDQPVAIDTTNLYAVPGRPVTNLVVAKRGSGGRWTFTSSARSEVDVTVDVQGYFRRGMAVPGGFVPVSATRVMNTRIGFGGLTPGPDETVDLQLTGRARDPGDRRLRGDAERRGGPAETIGPPQGVPDRNRGPDHLHGELHGWRDGGQLRSRPGRRRRPGADRQPVPRSDADPGRRRRLRAGRQAGHPRRVRGAAAHPDRGQRHRPRTGPAAQHQPGGRPARPGQPGRAGTRRAGRGVRADRDGVPLEGGVLPRGGTDDEADGVPPAGAERLGRDLQPHPGGLQPVRTGAPQAGPERLFPGRGASGLRVGRRNRPGDLGAGRCGGPGPGAGLSGRRGRPPDQSGRAGADRLRRPVHPRRCRPAATGSVSDSSSPRSTGSRPSASTTSACEGA